MKPRVLLIQPPIEDFYTTPLRLFPLGLTQIATFLDKAGYEVKILDCLSELNPKIIPVPQKFKYIKKYYDEKNKSPFRLFGRYYHFGMQWEEIAVAIRNYSPDVVGVSSNFSPYYEMALKCAVITKEVDNKIITVLGGTHASAMFESLLRHGAVDYVIRGEGEFAFKSFLSDMEQNNLKDKNRMRSYNIVENLDLLPPNNLSLILNTSNSAIAMIQTSRGCPLKCDFCAIPINKGKLYRTKSPERVLEEILHYRNSYDIRCIDIEDDNFTADKKRGLKILGLIKKYTDVQLSAMNGLSSAFLDKEILNKMKEAGFRKINLSLVAADSETKKNIHRKESLEHLEGIIRTADSLGIEVETHFIIGIPGEKPSQTMNSLIYLSQLPTKIGGSIFYPVPGTSLFNKCLEHNWIINRDDPSFCRLTLASTESYAEARKDQITFLYLVRIVNFIKNILKKYLLDEEYLRLPDALRNLNRHAGKFKTQELLGFYLLKKVIEEGIIYKALKSKKEYIYKREDELNQGIIEDFINKINCVEF